MVSDAVSVVDAMRPGVVACRPDDRLATLAAIMVTHGIHAIVVGPIEDGAPLIVTDLDLVRAALERADARAAEIACEPIATVNADALVTEAATAMSERAVSHLLVTEPSSNAPVGVISSFDVAAVLAGHPPRLARMLRPGPARPSSSAATLDQAQVRDVMHPGVITCPGDASLRAVARSMAEHRVHCVAVAEAGHPDERLMRGLVSDLDVVLALRRGAADEPVASIASTSPIAIGEQESLERAASLLVEHDSTHIVVTGPTGVPSGMLSTLDIASVLGSGA
jgi:CBS domain-containing protein